MKLNLFVKPIFREDYIEELQRIGKKLKKEYIMHKEKNIKTNLVSRYLYYLSELDNRVLNIMGYDFYDKLMVYPKIINMKEELYSIALLYTTCLEKEFSNNNIQKASNYFDFSKLLKEKKRYLDFLKTLQERETTIIFKNNESYKAIAISDTINCYTECLKEDVTLVDVIGATRILHL